MAFEKGDKVRVDIRGTVGEYQSSLAATNLVTETGETNWTHFLYVTSGQVTGNREPGGEVRAQFDAEVTGEPKGSKNRTTQVRELLPEGAGFTHYLYLDSKSVTRLEEKNPTAAQSAGYVPSIGTAARFAKGTKVAVDLSVIAGTREEFLVSTSKATETGGARWVHFLFLGSPRLVPENAAVGSTVRAQFNAEVTGEFRNSRSFTTRVREILPGGISGFTHYLFLESDAVTVLDPLGARASYATAGTITGGKVTVTVVPDTTTVVADRKITAAPITTKAGARTVSIDRYDTTISDSAVDSRISDLESETGYDVVRLRNDEVLATYADEDDARQYITDEDYDRERVVVRENELDDDDQLELDNLRELREALGGDSATYTLYNEDYFTGSWARDEARDVLGSDTDLDGWPLDNIDWDEAASERRDDLYPEETRFDDQAFYYAED